MNRTLWIIASALSLTLSACVVGPPYYEGDAVYVAPPPPRVEYYGAPPIAGQIWIDGYWNWSGSSHVWVPGRWEAPRPGYRWVPRTWNRDGDRWRQNGGRWEEHREQGREREHDRRDHRERRGW